MTEPLAADDMRFEKDQWIIRELDLLERWKNWHLHGPSVWLLPKTDTAPAGYGMVVNGMDLFKFRIPAGTHEDGPDDVVEFSLWEKHFWEKPAGLNCQFRASLEEVVEWCLAVKENIFSGVSQVSEYQPQRWNGHRYWEVCGCKYLKVAIRIDEEYELVDSLLYVVAKGALKSRPALFSQIWYGEPRNKMPAAWAFNISTK